MAKRYKTKDKDQPYGLTRDGAPRKRPGRRKGSAKSPGTGRSKQPIEQRLDTASDELALAVISGEPIHQYGTTGKAFTAPANLSLRQKFAEVWWNRRRPTLTATAIKAEVETIHKDPPEPRALARSILAVLETAKLADQPAEPPPPPEPPAPPAQLLLERSAIIELQATPFAGQPATAAAPAGPLGGQPPPAGPGGDGSRCSTASPSGSVAPLSSISQAARAFSPYSRDAQPPRDPGEAGSASGGDGASTPSPGVLSPLRKPQHADKVEVDSNSSHIWFNGESKRWAVLDSDNVLHGWKRDRAEALAHAERLPRGAGPRQAHPFEPQDMGSGWHERRDNKATISNGKLNVVRRMPRGAR